MARVTLQLIADRVGVSRMTVSNAFSRPDQLSAELRASILAVAAELGYHGPDPAARSLATGTSGAIGVLWTQPLRLALSDAVTARFLGAVADELSADGLALTMLPPTVPAHDVRDGRRHRLLLRRRTPRRWSGCAAAASRWSGVDMDWPDGRRTSTIDDRGGARRRRGDTWPRWATAPCWSSPLRRASGRWQPGVPRRAAGRLAGGAGRRSSRWSASSSCSATTARRSSTCCAGAADRRAVRLRPGGRPGAGGRRPTSAWTCRASCRWWASMTIRWRPGWG